MKISYKSLFYLILSTSLCLSVCNDRGYDEADTYIIVEYKSPCWITDDSILIIEHYQKWCCADDDIPPGFIVYQKLSICVVDTFGVILRKCTIPVDTGSQLYFTVDNTSVAGAIYLITMRISYDSCQYGIFNVARDGSSATHLAYGAYGEISYNGLSMLYIFDNSLRLRKINSSEYTTLYNGYAYSSFGPNNLIAFCIDNTLYINDCNGQNIQQISYSSACPRYPDWSLSPDTVLLSPVGNMWENIKLVCLTTDSIIDIQIQGDAVRWSPNRQKFIYWVYPNYYLINRDGSRQIKLDWQS